MMNKHFLATVLAVLVPGLALAAPNYPPPPLYVLTDLGDFAGGSD